MPKTYATQASGADKALDNLANVAINTSLLPGTNDGAALGSTSKQWSDLFLAEGGVINWDNGDATITQVGDVVTVAGADLKVTTPGNVSTSVLTTDGVQTVTGKTNLPIIIASSGTASSTTNDTNEHNLAVVTISAGLMGTNGSLQIYSLWKAVGTTNTKTPKIRHSTSSGDTTTGTALMTGTIGNTGLSLQMMTHVYNSNSASAQVLYPGNLNPYATAGTATALVTGAIDTANTSFINFNGSVTNAGDTLQLVAYFVLFHPGV